MPGRAAFLRAEHAVRPAILRDYHFAAHVETAVIAGDGAVGEYHFARFRCGEGDKDEFGNDAIVARKRGFLSLGYDHRIVNGADGDQVLARVKEILEAGLEDGE